MAAYTEYQETPWLASINNILTKTQQNLKKSRQFSQNRCKSFFLNSSDLLSTNFSLEKSDHIEFEVENFKKEFKSDLETGLEHISEGISQAHYRLRSLEMQTNISRRIKENTLCDLENTELQIMKKVSQVKNRKYCTSFELNFMKSRILQDVEEKTSVYKERLKSVQKRERLTEDFLEVPEFSQDYARKSKFLRYCKKTQGELTEKLNETCKRIKKNCRRSLRTLDTREKYISDLGLHSFCSKSNSLLSKKPPQPPTLSPELSSLTKKSSVLSSMSEKLKNCSVLMADHELSSIKSKICSEISEIFEKELKVNTLLNRLNQLEHIQNIEKKFCNEGVSFERKPLDQFTKININYMGESDEDSLSFTSPTPSPLNNRISLVNSTKHTSKKFKFSGDTIEENPDEYERYSPELENKR